MEPKDFFSGIKNQLFEERRAQFEAEIGPLADELSDAFDKIYDMYYEKTGKELDPDVCWSYMRESLLQNDFKEENADKVIDVMKMCLMYKAINKLEKYMQKMQLTKEVQKEDCC